VAKRRVLYLISTFLQGGAQRHLLELVRFLDPAMFDVSFCALNDVNHFGADLPAGQPQFCLGGPVFWSPLAFAKLVRALKSFRPDILHCYMNDGNLWGRLASRLWRPRAVLTSVHLDAMSPLHRFWERRLYPLSDRIVAHSRSIERLLVQDLGVPAVKVKVIVNGVDVTRFRAVDADSRRTARSSLGLDDDAFIALMPARIAEQKNQDLVIEALGALRARGALPTSFRLLLAGGISSHTLSRKVDKLIAQHRLQAQVARLGAVKDMQSLYWAADVALLPSRTEASPIAALEALSVAIPVLISDTSNTDDVVVPGEHGWQVRANDRADLERGLADVFATPRVELARRGLAGRAHVEAHFTNQGVAAHFTHLYDEVAPEQGS
jgi:glycosyltransferase involved in cell wall biosynthesis